MWLAKGNTPKKGARCGLVAVAIDKDKSSQNALKWTVEHLVNKGQTIVLIHVSHNKPAASLLGGGILEPDEGPGGLEKHTRDLFLSYHCYCTRKDITCLDILLEDADRVKAIIDYVSVNCIENLVLGAPSRGAFMRRFRADIPSSVSKAAPDFCTVYVISKGKISYIRNAARQAPYVSPLLNEIENQTSVKNNTSSRVAEKTPPANYRKATDRDSDKSPFTRPIVQGRSPVADWTDTESDISFISSTGRPSTDASSFMCDYPESDRSSRVSNSSEHSIGSLRLGIKFTDLSSAGHDFSSASQDSGWTSSTYSSHSIEDAEVEMMRLKLQLKQTMDMYSMACKEALTARHQANELQRVKYEDERRLEDAKIHEESETCLVERERAKARAAMEAAEASKRVAEMEMQRRVNAEMKAINDAEEMREAFDSFHHGMVRYRRYTIDEIEEATNNFSQACKIGEGGYGPVYKCRLDHTPVAVKVLRPDAAQGRSQFQKEVEVLSCIRHPNMVLLLGACPEFGILVYEHMAKGSLEDRLFKHGNSPPLSWQIRFRVAAEIATGLLFLHQTKPEPLVHRDLKPGNILLDNNYVSKIGDVGLAKLVPAVAENVTQCHMTSTAGTFCYIDPEYQQTGMLGVKSDVYSLGIMLLQLLTAKPPMGLAYYVEQAIEHRTFTDVLDPDVPNWPVEEALSLARLGLQCAELRRKDRPDLGKVLLPELNRLRDLAEASMEDAYFGYTPGVSPNMSQVSIPTERISDPQMTNSESPTTES